MCDVKEKLGSKRNSKEIKDSHKKQIRGLRDRTSKICKLKLIDDCNNENYNGNLDNGDDDAFQQVFKAKFACQVKPIAPSGAGLEGRQANANHPSQDSDDVDNDFMMASVKQIHNPLPTPKYHF